MHYLIGLPITHATFGLLYAFKDKHQTTFQSLHLLKEGKSLPRNRGLRRKLRGSRNKTSGQVRLLSSEKQGFRK